MKPRTLSFNLKAGIFLALIIGGISLTGLFYQPYDYNLMDSEKRFSPPSFSHLMGTDNFGRDVFSRLMAGARYTLLIAFFTVAGSAIIGTILGLSSGYMGGFWDEIIMRLMDALSSFPGILLALVMIALFGNSPGTLVMALMILFIPGFTRIMRNGILQYKTRDFILAARITGVPHSRIIFVHILPNLYSPLLSASVIGFSNAILAESTMSYLGLGIQPPEASLGRMLSESQMFLFTAPWYAISTGMAIVLLILGFGLLGEGYDQGNGNA